MDPFLTVKYLFMKIDLSGGELIPDVSFDIGSLPDDEASEIKRAVPIFCSSPFLALPRSMPFKFEIWLDTNILARAREPEENQNIRNLINWANTQGLSLNPGSAITELFRSTSKLDAEDMALRGLECLRDKYGARIDINWANGILPSFYAESKNPEEYGRFLARLLIVVKFFYNQKHLTHEERCEAFAKYMSKNLPITSSFYLLASLYIFTQENNIIFGTKELKKIRKDMKILKTREENMRAAINLAGDFSMFTATSYNPLPDGKTLSVPYIATADKGLLFVVKEMCYFGFDFSTFPPKGVPGYRPSSIAGAKLDNLAKNNISAFLTKFSHREIEKRLHKLRTISGELIASNFTKGIKI